MGERASQVRLVVHGLARQSEQIGLFSVFMANIFGFALYTRIGLALDPFAMLLSTEASLCLTLPVCIQQVVSLPPATLFRIL